MVVQPNKAVVGQNAFAHEAGIHQDGVLKERSTYEIMDPQELGAGPSQLVLGKHSGRHAFQERLLALGYDVGPERQRELFARFKALTDRKKQVTEEDLRSLVEDELYRPEQPFVLDHCHVSSTAGGPATASVAVRWGEGGALRREAAVAGGPVEAVCAALGRATGIAAQLLDYRIQSVGGGLDAQGEARCTISAGGLRLVGSGVSTDIIEASAAAYLHALNKAAASGAGAPAGGEAV